MSNIRHHIHKQLLAFNKKPCTIDYDELARQFGPQEGPQGSRLLRQVIANLSYINFIIEKIAGRAIAKIDAPVLTALQMGTAELLFMATKQHAAVFENVELLPKGKSYLRGFVNGVLRSISRQIEAKKLPLPTDISTLYSHPAWLVEMMQNTFGELRSRHFFAANNQAQPTVFRINRLHRSRAEVQEVFTKLGIHSRASLLSSDGLIVDDLPALHTPGLAELWNAGVLYFQNEAAQLTSLLLAPQPGETIVDLCSAPGGKATHLADISNDQARIIAVDQNPNKLRLLQDNIRRLQLRSITLQQSDATDPRLIPFIQEADAILLDPPCSGMGVLRKSPEGRWRQSLDDLQRLASQQLQMLAFVLQHMRHGARAIYSVCTPTPSETLEVIEMAKSLPSFRFTPIDPQWQGGVLQEYLHNGCFLSLTGDGKTTENRNGALDGYFMACFSKQ